MNAIDKKVSEDSTSGEAKIRFVVLCLGIWLHAASSMLAATTLPAAVPEIGGEVLVAWAFSLYQLGSILAGAATGLMVARTGVRIALLGGGVLYGTGSALCALAPEMSLLLGGRLLQGVGGGWLVALTYLVINRQFASAEIPKYVAFTSAVWSVSAFCGPLLGGSFAGLGLWRLAFWAFTVQAGLFVVAVAIFFSADERESAAEFESLPLLRLALIASAVLCVSMAAADYHLVGSPLLCTIGLSLLITFLAIDRRSPGARMYPRDALDPRRSVGAGILFVFLASAASMSFLVYGPFLLISRFELTPLQAGYVVVLESVSWGLAAVAFARFNVAPETRLIRFGSIFITLSLLGFAATIPDGPLWAVIPWPVMQGAGFGMMWGFIVRRMVAAVPAAERDLASSALPTTQQIGFAVGAAAVGILANANGFTAPMSDELAKTVGFWLFAGVVPLALLANGAAWRLTRRETNRPLSGPPRRS